MNQHHPTTRARLGGGGARSGAGVGAGGGGPAAALAEDREREECRREYLRLGGSGRLGRFGKRRWRFDDTQAQKRNPLYELLTDCRDALAAGCPEADAVAGLELVLAKVRAAARRRDETASDVIALHVAHVQEAGESDLAVARFFQAPTVATMDAAIKEAHEAHTALGRFLDRLRTDRVLRGPPPAPPALIGLTPTGVPLGLHP